jgi:TonB family protein
MSNAIRKAQLAFVVSFAGASAQVAASPTPPSGPSAPSTSVAPATSAAPAKTIDSDAWLRFAPDGPLADAKRARRQRERQDDSYEGQPFEVRDGELRGTWTLHHPAAGAKPDAALRLRFAEAPPYTVTMQYYCNEGDVECGGIRKPTDAMKAPYPTNPVLVEDWRRIVQSERCDASRAVKMDPPVYPSAELRSGVHGVVKIRIVFNPCGEVREAWVVESSGNRNLDRAVIKAANRWVIRNEVPGVGGIAQTAVSFSF